MKLLFIVNPTSGSHQFAQTEAAIKDALTNDYIQNGKVINYETLVPSNVSELKTKLRQKLTHEQVQTVAVVGGDGTVMDALEVLIEFPEVCLGIIPRGTGNLLAGNLKIPLELEAALKVILNGIIFNLDVGRIGDKFFALTAGVGIDADIMEQTNKLEKKRMGIGAYFFKGLHLLTSLRRTRLKVTIDGRQINTRGIGVLVSNVGNLLGPFLSLAPDAAPDDGNLHVCILKVSKQEDLIAAFMQILTQAYSDDDKHAIQYIRGKKILIESWPTVKVEADGTVIGQTPVELEALPGKIKVLVPNKPSETIFDPGKRVAELNTLIQSVFADFRK
jgi:YegS/Rv2252/BmrU family lipid kinase